MRRGLEPVRSPGSNPPLATDRVAVVVMAKDPQPGRTKTRLCPRLTESEAADFYSAMLADRCDQIRQLDNVVRGIAIADWDGTGARPAVVPDDFEAVPQPPGGLGVGLAAAAEHFLRRGNPVVLVDSDSPTLPLAHLAEAVERLRGASDEGANELVMIPSDDGGYCLIGMRQPAPSLFADMPWSTDQVVSRTLERARELGLRIHVLPTWWDVDDGADLDRLEQSLLSSWWPVRTADWLRARRRRIETPAEALGEPKIPEDQLWRAPWTRLSSRRVYATPWLEVREDSSRTPTGELTTYSVVDCGRCVGVLPFVTPETVLMVRQYRYVIDRTTWEMPTGGVHRGETPIEAARRELAEEARVRAAEIVPICTYHTSKSVMDETAHLFVARGVTPAEARSRDSSEFIRIEEVPFERVLEMVRGGEITDSMTIIAVLHVANGA